MVEAGHGGASLVDAWSAFAVLEGDDPALALVHADLDAWLAAHPCACEYLCECECEEYRPVSDGSDGGSE